MGNNQPKRRLKKSVKDAIKRYVCIMAAVAIALTAWPIAAYAKDAIGSRIEIEKIEGTAYIVKASGKKTDARVGVKLNMDESLQTAAGSYVYIGIDNDKVVKVDELSQINIKRTGKKLTLEAEEGSLFFDVKEKLSSDVTMNISASTMAMSIRGTCGVVGVRRVGENIVTSVDLLEGRVDMNYDDVSGANHNFTMWGGESTTHKDGSDAVERDLIDITEIAGFAAVEFANDEALGAKVLENSGLNPVWPKEHWPEMLEKEQAFNAEHYSDVFVEGNTSSVASLKGKRNVAMGIPDDSPANNDGNRDSVVPLFDGLDEGDLVLASADVPQDNAPQNYGQDATPSNNQGRTMPVRVNDANFDNVVVKARNLDAGPSTTAPNNNGSANSQEQPSNNVNQEQGSTTIVSQGAVNPSAYPTYMMTYYDHNGLVALNEAIAAKQKEEENNNSDTSSSSSSASTSSKEKVEDNPFMDMDLEYLQWLYYMNMVEKAMEAAASSSSSSSSSSTVPTITPIITQTPQPTSQPQPGPAPGPSPAKTYTVNFYVNYYDEDEKLVQNGLIKTEKVESGKAATAPQVGYDFPERTDTEDMMYLFNGWDKKFDEVTNNLEVTAEYTTTPLYTVTFVDPKSDNPLDVKKQKVIKGQYAKAEELPVHGTIVSYGWGLGDSLFNFKTTPINENIKLSALYKSYKVKFMIDESQLLVSYSVEEGKTIPSYPPSPSKEGYEFTGWKCTTDPGKEPTSIIVKDTTFMASFKEMPKEEYDVTFIWAKSMTEDGRETIKVKHGDKAVPPVTPPDLDDRLFDKWVNEDDLSGGIDAPITKPTTFFASYQYREDYYYDVKFSYWNEDGSEWITNNVVKVRAGQKVIPPEIATNPGDKKFIEWEAGGEYTLDHIIDAPNMYFTAKYEDSDSVSPTPTPAFCEVTGYFYHGNPGTFDKDDTATFENPGIDMNVADEFFNCIVPYGHDVLDNNFSDCGIWVDNLNIGTRTYKVLYKDDIVGNSLSSIKSDAIIIVYPVKCKYKFSYMKSNSGEYEEITQFVEPNEKVVLPEIPSIEGKTFMGWVSYTLEGLRSFSADTPIFTEFGDSMAMYKIDNPQYRVYRYDSFNTAYKDYKSFDGASDFIYEGTCNNGDDINAIIDDLMLDTGCHHTFVYFDDAKDYPYNNYYYYGMGEYNEGEDYNGLNNMRLDAVVVLFDNYE